MSDRGPSDSRRSSRLQIRDLQAGRDAIIAGTVIIQTDSRDPLAQSSHLPPHPPGLPGSLLMDEDPRPDITLAALAYLMQPETCIYLGHRYGLTPESQAGSGLLKDLGLGVEPPQGSSISSAVSWLGRQSKIGELRARQYLANRYGLLDEEAPEVDQELRNLASLVSGRVFVTGSYSSRIQHALGTALAVIQNDGEVIRDLLPGRSDRALLFMLHGSEQDFERALLAENDIRNYRRLRPVLTAEISKLLLRPWILLGADEKIDATFYRLMEASFESEPVPKRLFLVDSRPETETEAEWPRHHLQRVHMTVNQFLSLALNPGPFRPIPTIAQSPWYRRRCAECKHTFRRGDLVATCPRCGRVYHWNPVHGLDCVGVVFANEEGRCLCRAERVPEPPPIPSDVAKARPMTAFLRSLAHEWSASGGQDLVAATPKLEGRLCAVCGHTVRLREMVVLCPCGNGPGNVCSAVIHLDFARQLYCWKEWLRGRSKNYCPLTGHEFHPGENTR